MRILRALFPFTLILAVGCAAAPGTATKHLLISEATPAVFPTDDAAGIPTVKPAGFSTSTPSDAPQVVSVIDDFEADETSWNVCADSECADSSATLTELPPDHASHGTRALKLVFEKTEKPKAVFYIEQPMDLTAGTTIQFDIYHEGTIEGVGLALTTGEDLIWHESDSVPVERGNKVTITFDLAAGTYKTAATNWEFRAPIANLDKVVRLSIIVYPRAAGSAIIDYLCLMEPR
jgi:hypothetical protein